ncbi:MAG TPA: hypothetical protein VF065_03745, partial [Ilumatobacter sp.]
MGAKDNTLVARAEALEAEPAVIAVRRGRRSAGPGDSEPQSAADIGPVADRRGVVKLLAAGAVGAVAGTALHGQTASAADGDPVRQGLLNEATKATTLHASSESALVLWSPIGFGVISDGVGGNALFP